MAVTAYSTLFHGEFKRQEIGAHVVWHSAVRRFSHFNYLLDGGFCHMA
ncbi:MAG: hypothetical protein HN926_02030 [Chloroflexi bacterium]|nr:hypothetical protein [Chloroflexota bacterium]MBT7078132.1 hypothetical protein [Chloroflexota bacterium]